MSFDAELEAQAALYGSPRERHDSSDVPAGLLRVPPQSIEAEQAVLGGLMLKPIAWQDVSDILSSETFYRRDHQMIWTAIAWLEERRRPFDAVTVGEWFQARGEGDLVAGGKYLIDLASNTPSVANIRAYAEIVADKSRLRRLIDVGVKLQNDGFNPDGRDSVEIIGEAHTHVASLLDAQPCDSAPISDAMARVYEELSARQMDGGGMDGLPTGFTDFDEILGGLVPGLHLLAGRPKHGKSTVAQNIAEYVALHQRKAVQVLILEMSEDQYAKRVISSVGRVDSQRMRRGTLDDQDWSNVAGAVKRMRGAPLYIRKPGTSRPEHITAAIRRQHAKTPLGLVVLDYLQLIEVVTQKGENYSTAVGRVTRSLVNLAQELKVPILCLSQLSREAEKEGRPKPSHLRDSGSIEADAESVTFVYREEMNDSSSKFAGTVEVIVALNRNGPAGNCRLLFRGDKYRCENLPPDWEPEPKPEGESKQARKGFRKRGGNPGADAAAGDA